jgi:Ca2+:H+ antiporter
MMAERRVAHTRQSTDSQIISQHCSGQRSPNLLSTAEASSVDAQDLEKAGGELLKPTQRFKTTWDRFLGRGRKPVGVIQSIKKIYGCSCMSLPPVCDVLKYLMVVTGLNLLLILTPVAWWAHFDERFADNHTAIFSRMSFAK